MGLTRPFGACASETIQASNSQPGFPPNGARDGERFATKEGSLWKGKAGETQWEWQIDFGEAKRIGAILMVQGDHPFVFRNAATEYVWETNGPTGWARIGPSWVKHERRIFHLLALPAAIEARELRLHILDAAGDYPSLREVEFLTSTNCAFPDWAIVVNTTHDSHLPGHGQEFIPLAKQTPAGNTMQFQQIWLDAFDPDFVSLEPQPLCAFLSGNFKDWCEVDRRLWRGTEKVLGDAALPIWASCGGAQGLAILAETGTEQPWDCPHCRDPKKPKLPIYTHIGHTSPRKCGDYSGCIFERGAHQIKQMAADPIFGGLQREFSAMESHCGQIDHAPKGWHVIAGAGAGTKTKMQCLRLDRAPVYAAQFHIEMEGTPDTSRTVMENFLKIAREWRRPATLE